MTEEENSRRISGLESRVEALDLHGTRGMEGMRAQLGLVQRDVGKLESSVDRVETAVQAMQLTLATIRPRSTWPQVFAYAVMVLPIYALVVDLIARGKG